MRRHLTEVEIFAFTGLERPIGAAGSDPATLDAVRAQAHLDACAACRERLESAREVVEALHAVPLAAAPQTWVQTAIGWIRAQESAAAPVAGRSAGRTAGHSVGHAAGHATESAAGHATEHTAGHTVGRAAGRAIGRAAGEARRLVQEVRATLVLDTGGGAALQGIRGSATLQPRQLLYESPLGDLHLQIDPEGGRTLGILGQLLPREGEIGPDPARVVIERDGKETIRRISANGEFRVRGLAPGRVRVRLEWGAHRLVLDPLDLPAGSDA